MLIKALLFLINYWALVKCQNCDDFTLGSCANEDTLIWENDQVHLDKYLDIQ